MVTELIVTGFANAVVIFVYVSYLFVGKNVVDKFVTGGVVPVELCIVAVIGGVAVLVLVVTLGTLVISIPDVSCCFHSAVGGIVAALRRSGVSGFGVLPLAVVDFVLAVTYYVSALVTFAVLVLIKVSCGFSNYVVSARGLLKVIILVEGPSLVVGVVAELISAIIADTVVVIVAVLVVASKFNVTSAGCVLPVLFAIGGPSCIVGVIAVALLTNVTDTVVVLVVISVVCLVLGSYVTVTSILVPVSGFVIRPFGVVGVSAHYVCTNVTFAVVVRIGVRSFFSVVNVTSADNFLVVLVSVGGVVLRVSVFTDLELTSCIITNTVVVVVNVVALYSFFALITKKVLIFVYVLGTFNSSLASVTEEVTVGVNVYRTGLVCGLTTGQR